VSAARFALVALAGCAAAHSGVYGVVRDRSTGHPLVRVPLTVAPLGSRGAERLAFTDDHGRYRVDGLPPGRYRVAFYYAAVPATTETDVVSFAPTEVSKALDLTGTPTTDIEYIIACPLEQLDSLAGRRCPMNGAPSFGCDAVLDRRWRR